MAEIQNLAKFLNPLTLHLQKLGLELKCPLCLNFLNKPMLLPCNHIICHCCIPISSQIGSECPACKNQYNDQEIRPAPHMESLIIIYRSLYANFSSFLSRASSSEHASASVIPANIDKLKEEPTDVPGDEAGKSAKVCLENITRDRHDSPNGCDEVGIFSSQKANKRALSNTDLNKELEQHCGHQMTPDGRDCFIPMRCYGSKGSYEGLETQEEDAHQGPELSPESSPSLGDIKAPGSRSGSLEKCKAKVKVEYLDTMGGDMHGRALQGGTSYERDAKRQKMFNYSSSEAGLKSTGLTQEKVCHSDNMATSNCNLAHKIEKDLSVAQPKPVSHNKSVCAFCRTSNETDGTGPLLFYANGREVDGEMTTVPNVIPVHSKCIEWTPRVYYEDEKIKNLELELGRAAKLKCSSCGQKGAALGCFEKSCRRTYHVPCALEIQGCRWDSEDFLMLCPSHKSVKFPREKFKSRKSTGPKHPMSTEMINTNSEFWATSPSGPKEWVFCGSALSPEEKFILVKFATMCGATVSKFWRANVTHVIAATDEKGACTRTLKVLMGILNGRWILNMGWIKACVEANHPANEEPYEISSDNHGCLDGPKTGRLRVSNKDPKLFEGLKFYFTGDFVPAYKIDLYDLVRTAGGAIIESMEQLMIQSHDVQPTGTRLVVYNGDPPRGCAMGEESSIVSLRIAEARNMANQTNALLVRHTWILDSIAGGLVC